MDCDIVIIGAGVVGLAIASEISSQKQSVFVLEQHGAFGQETSSRNSEVIHAGIYYPQSSLKAKLCVEGAKRLYRLCAEAKIAHARIGKLIVAVKEEEIASLESLRQKGEANGVAELRMIDGAELKRMEPNVQALAALYSPHTGIVDSHQLMKHYEAKAQARGASIVYGCKAMAAEKIAGGYRIATQDQNTSSEITSRIVINAAGLYSDQVAALPGMELEAHGLKLHFCKGEYFGVSPAKSRMVSRLVYPSPMEELTGLGIHATKDLGGRLKLGPNALYADKIGYEVDPGHLDSFFESAKPFLPFLAKEDLFPDMAGMRPKLSAQGEKARDFYIHHEADKGLEGWINLIGIESPGLTASPAIADYVHRLLKESCL